MFVEVLVEEILTDPAHYTQEVLREIVPRLEKGQEVLFCDQPIEQPGADDDPPDPSKHVYFLRAPRNTILGRALEDTKTTVKDENGDPKPDGFLKVYYPFFSSHFSLPVKPGETVWAYNHDGVFYWLSRVPQPLNAEDPNFTHPDRRALPTRKAPIKVTKEGKTDAEQIEDNTDNTIERVPNFPNGAQFAARNTDVNREPGQEDLDDEAVYPEESLRFPLDDTDHPTRNYYDHLHDNNQTAGSIVYEPVPRITKRPGDLVLQGSNNSSILLGTQDGAYDPVVRPEGEDNPSITTSLPVQLSQGMIDIVAGRGRIHQTFDSDKIADKPPQAETTRPRVAKNIREEFETDKNIGLDADPNDLEDSGHLHHAQEGDPDFLHDASRIFVSMNASPDLLLGTEYPQIAVPGDPDEEGAVDNAGVDVEPANDAATVIIKSDEIRIVARRKEEDDPTDGDPEINGSIKIVKEGVADSRDGDGRAVIMIQPDGTIMIDGPKIVIGSGAKAEDDGNGAGAQITLGLGATESMILGDELKATLEDILDAIMDLTVPTGTGPSDVPINSDTFQGIRDGLDSILSKIGKTL